MSRTTITAQLTEALKDGDNIDDVLCYWQDDPDDSYAQEKAPIRGGMAVALPTRSYDKGYGGRYGPRFIGFTERYVYVCGVYDGAEWIVAVPRNPSEVTFIPVIGGE